MEFRLHAWRFSFRAIQSIHFPPGKSGNILRGTFGLNFRKRACAPECTNARECPLRHSCVYARIFEPREERGPSGLLDSPRPFVFRATHLDGRTLREGEMFYFDLHVFDTQSTALECFVGAFSDIAHEGLGPRRGKAELLTVSQAQGVLYDCVHGTFGTPQSLNLPLQPQSEQVRQLRLTFVSPTELKASNTLAERPAFGVVYGRARDRVSTLRRLYGDGPLEIDFRETLARARKVKMIRCDLRYVDAERRSTRTGQTHPLGGFVGVAEYDGDIAEFLPVLRVAQWTGIGRQTVWGKGAVQVEVLS